LFLLTYF